jgi:hypothetical protein
VQGTIEFDRCRFEDAGRAGIAVNCNSVRGVKIRFANCTLADPAEKPGVGPPIVLASQKGDLDDVGNLEFAGFTIREKTERPPLRFHNDSGRRLGNLSGSLTVELNGKRTDYVVDPSLVERLRHRHAKPAQR